MAPAQYFPFITLFLLLQLGVCSVNARKDLIGDHWTTVMKDQRMSKAIQSLVPVANSDDHDCDTNKLTIIESHTEQSFGKDIIPGDKFAKEIESQGFPFFYNGEDGIPSNKFAKEMESHSFPFFCNGENGISSNKFVKEIESQGFPFFYNGKDSSPSNKFAKEIESQGFPLFYNGKDDTPSNKFAKDI